ncbi:TPA: hypothetical protein R1956_002640, partial [Staphylococcus delphini]|nr:hypothetical protein [Staphylococcus delphini]
IINDKDLKSNKVVVNKKVEKPQPPEPKPESKPESKPPIPNKINKFILSNEHKLVDKIDLKDENVDYVIEHQIGNEQDIKTLRLVDDLEDALDINKDVKVYMKDSTTDKATDNVAGKTAVNDKANDKAKEEEKTVDAKKETPVDQSKASNTTQQSSVENIDFTKGYKDITKEGTLKVDEEKEIYEWTAKDPKALQGKEIFVEVKAKVKKDAKLDKYTAQDVA